MPPFPRPAEIPSRHRSPVRHDRPRDLRGFLDANRDAVTVVRKPVRIDHVGALSAQSERPILFENIVEYPGFRMCDILVKHRWLQAARPRGHDGGIPAHPCPEVAAAAAGAGDGGDRAGQGGETDR